MGARAHHLALLAILAVLVVTACDSGDDGIPVVTVTGQPLVVTGTTAAYTATTTNANDTGYVWSTSDPTIAQIDGTGLLTALTEGTVVVSAVGNLSGTAGTLTIACSPIPTDVVPFYDEWSEGPHNDATAEAFVHWDEEGEIPVDCARCHSTPGFQDYLGEDGTAAGIVDNPAPIGTTVECIACHNEASFAYTEVTFPSGVVIDDLGREAVCMTCHQGRSSTESVDDVIDAAAPPNDDTILPAVGFINVHYFPAAATRYGGEVDGGYAYEDKVYDILFKHVPGYERCQDCHDPHSLEIKLDECAECHSVTTESDLFRIRMESSKVNDYDGDGDLVEGLYFEIDTLRDLLLGAIQTYANEHPELEPIVYTPAAYPYWFRDTDADGIADAGETIFPNRYTTYTARLLKATYNYQYAVKDPGGFAHNGKFIIQILHDSIEDLNAYTGTDVDMSAAVRNDMGHFDGTALPFRDWDDTGTVPASCSKCHSASPGFAEFLTYQLNTPQDMSNGFDCAVCHTTFDTFETRRILTVTFPPIPGGRSFSVDSSLPTDDPAVQSNICITCHQGRQSKKSLDDAITNWIALGKPAYPTTGSLGFQNVHYLAAAADVFGTEAQVAYEYTRSYGSVTILNWAPSTVYTPGQIVANAGRTYVCITGGTSDSDVGSGPKTTGLDITDGTVHWRTYYSNKFPHAAPGSNTNHCVFCHSPVNTTHTFLPNDNIALCKICHAGLTDDVEVIRLNRPFDYDGDGNNTEHLNDEVQGLATRLYAAIQNYAAVTPGRGRIVYDAHTSPYWFKDLDADGVTDPNEVTSANRYRNFDEKLLPACHNYQQSQKEPGAWAHSVDYVAQCVYDSIADLGGSLAGLTRAPVNY